MLLLVIIYLTVSRRHLLLVPTFTLAAVQKESLAAYAVFSAVHLLTQREAKPQLPQVATAAAIVVVPFALVLLRLSRTHGASALGRAIASLPDQKRPARIGCGLDHGAAHPPTALMEVAKLAQFGRAVLSDHHVDMQAIKSAGLGSIEANSFPREATGINSER